MLKYFQAFALGALLGTLLDGIHAYGDVLAYPDPLVGRWGWFVPLEFGLLGMAVALAMPRIERAVARGRELRWPISTRVAEVALFAALYLASVAVNGEAAAELAVALGVLAGARLLLAAAPGDWAYAAAGALLGPAAEAALVALGAFEYSEPDFAGIPIWLPPLWANAGLMIRRLVLPIVAPNATQRARTGAGRSLPRR